MMGLVVKDDGWRMPDWLWGADRAGTAAAAAAPVGMPPSARARPRRDGRDPVGVAHGDAVERLERDRDLFVELGAPAFPGVGAGRRLPRDLAAGAAGIRQGRRDRLGLVGGRW